jgi:hypothetical protein
MIGESDDAYVPDTLSVAFFWLLKCGTPDQWVRFWSGFGNYPHAADAIDTRGGIYTGLGDLQGLPELALALNGAFSGLEFSLSGLTVEALVLAGVDRDLVDGASIHVGMRDLGPFFEPVGGTDWLMRAIAGKPRTKRQGTPPQAVRTVTLPATLAFQDTNLTASQFLTPTGQRARSADDAFCDLTPAYSSNSTVKWPA